MKTQCSGALWASIQPEIKNETLEISVLQGRALLVCLRRQDLILCKEVLKKVNTYMIYLSPVVAIILWIIAVKLWNLALNKYRSTST